MRIVWSIVLAALTVPAAWYSVTYCRVLASAYGAWGELSVGYFLHPRFTVYHKADGLAPQPDGPPQIRYSGQRGIDWFRVADPPTGVDPEQWSIPSVAIAAPSSVLVIFTVVYAAGALRSRGRGVT
jgi:hypothetical protein